MRSHVHRSAAEPLPGFALDEPEVEDLCGLIPCGQLASRTRLTARPASVCRHRSQRNQAEQSDPLAASLKSLAERFDPGRLLRETRVVASKEVIQ